MHDKPNSFLIYNWTLHVKSCKAKKDQCHDQRTLNNFLKPKAADQTETATVQCQSLGVPTNNDNANAEITKNLELSSTSLNNHKHLSSTDDNQQVFRLAPPIVHQQ